MEFSRHAEEIKSERSCISRRQREMVIAPAACRQTFKLKMRVCKGEISVTALNVSGVVKNGQSRLVFVNCLSHALCVIEIGFNAHSVSVFLVIGVFPSVQHFLYAVLTIARQSADYVKEDAVTVILLNNLLHLRDE